MEASPLRAAVSASCTSPSMDLRSASASGEPGGRVRSLDQEESRAESAPARSWVGLLSAKSAAWRVKQSETRRCRSQVACARVEKSGPLCSIFWLAVTTRDYVGK